MTMKLKSRLGAGSQPGRSLTRGNTELLERFTPNTVSLLAALTKEKGPSPSSMDNGTAARMSTDSGSYSPSGHLGSVFVLVLRTKMAARGIRAMK